MVRSIADNGGRGRSRRTIRRKSGNGYRKKKNNNNNSIDCCALLFGYRVFYYYYYLLSLLVLLSDTRARTRTPYIVYNVYTIYNITDKKKKLSIIETGHVTEMCRRHNDMWVLDVCRRIRRRGRSVRRAVACSVRA